MGEQLRSDVTVFRNARSIIAESLWWDGHGGGALRWCDITAGTVHRGPHGGSADGTDDAVLTFPAPLSAFQPLASGAGFVYSGLDYVATADERGVVHGILARVTHRTDQLRFNEAKCDPFGRFVVGSMDLQGTSDGAIYSVDSAGSLRVLLGGIGVANGFEWSNDARTMWFTDTATQTIYAGDYSEAGELSNVRPFVHGRASDGLTRDADGGFWNGIYDTGRVVRWDASGELDLEFDVPAGHVTGVAFGGPDLATLFIGTARENLTEHQLDEQPLTGSIFAVETSTRGFPAHTFGTAQEGTQ